MWPLVRCVPQNSAQAPSQPPDATVPEHHQLHGEPLQHRPRLALGGVLCAALSTVAPSAARAAVPSHHPWAHTVVLDEPRIARDRFGPDAPWFEHTIPFFESADSTLDRIYYYRWQLFHAHLRDLGPRGYIVTEFLDDVAWRSQPYASLNDATTVPIYEGRWLRDRRYVNDHIDFTYTGGRNDRHCSEAIADAA